MIMNGRRKVEKDFQVSLIIFVEFPHNNNKQHWPIMNGTLICATQHAAHDVSKIKSEMK